MCLVAETVPGFLALMVIALLSMDPHMSLLRSALKGSAAAAVGMLSGYAFELSWPHRKRIVAAVIMVRTKFNTALVIAVAGVVGAVLFRGSA